MRANLPPSGGAGGSCAADSVRAVEPGRVLHSALKALERWLESDGIPHVFIGGIAVGLVGKPRTTRDIDGIVLLGSAPFEGFLGRAAAAGFPARIENAGAFARLNRVFLLRHERTGVDVDLSAGALPFEEEVVQRARIVTVSRLEIPVATPEDLVILKAIAGRPQDIADIATNRRLDRKRVRSLTALFAEALDTPDILQGLDRLLDAARSVPRKRPGSSC